VKFPDVITIKVLGQVYHGHDHPGRQFRLKKPAQFPAKCLLLFRKSEVHGVLRTETSKASHKLCPKKWQFEIRFDFLIFDPFARDAQIRNSNNEARNKSQMTKIQMTETGTSLSAFLGF
jgi:hypothetical protein